MKETWDVDGLAAGSPERRWRLLRAARERGQTLVLVALSIVVLAGFLALVIDLGNVYAQRRLMQGAADAGALAGARCLALALPLPSVDSDVREYTRVRNGADAYELQVLTDTVTVTVSKACRLYFAPLIGVDRITVGASATAGYGFPGSWKGHLMPVVVHKDAVDGAGIGDTIQIWDDQKAATDFDLGRFGNGHRGWLNFNGGSVGADELKEWAQYGYDGQVDVGIWVNGTPGTDTSALKQMVVHIGKVVIIPVCDATRPGVMGSGSVDYHICGFAAILVQKVVDKGNPKYIEGQFQRMVAAQEAGGTYDSGVRVINLQ